MVKLFVLVFLLLALAFVGFIVVGASWLFLQACKGLLRGVHACFFPRVDPPILQVVHRSRQLISSKPAPARPRQPSSVPMMVGLLVIGLIVFGVTSQDRQSGGQFESSAFAQQDGDKVQIKPSSAEKTVSWSQVGRGVTRAEAREKAVQQLTLEVQDHVRARLPGLEWTPSVDYVDRHLVSRTENLKDMDVPDKNGAHLGTVRQVEITVSVKPEDYQKFVRQDRELRAHERMFTLGKLLGVLFLAFALFGAYVRLDEYSKGYYSILLGMAALAIAGAGLFFLFVMG